MRTITDEQIEQIGLLVDQADNLLAATQLPGLRPEIHLEGLTGGVESMRKELFALHEALAEPQSVQAGMPWSEIAASAYRAYVLSLRHEDSHPLKTMPASLRTAWEAAVRQAGACLEQHRAPDETRWIGWTPPE